MREFNLNSANFPTIQEATSGCSDGIGRTEPQRQNPDFKLLWPSKPKFLQQQRHRHIPVDIVKEILPRLPGDSLARFKCVSKLWNSIISNPDFTHSNVGRSAKVVLMTFNDNGSFSVHFMNDEAVIEEIPWRRKEAFRKDPQENYTEFIGGSCNGLLLLVLGKSFYLWSPSTRYIKKILQLNYIGDFEYEVKSSGLCFDDSTNDYKVVMGLEDSSGDKFVLVTPLRRKQWERFRFSYNGVTEMQDGPVLNGFLHWKINIYGIDVHFRLIIKDQKLVAFDPRTDEFKEFPMPEARGRGGNCILGLGVLGGCLSIVHWDNKRDCFDDGNFQVLVMKEYGVKESWTTMLEISSSVIPYLCYRSPSHTKVKPLLLMRNGEIVLKFDNVIIIYNPTYQRCNWIDCHKFYGEYMY